MDSLERKDERRMSLVDTKGLAKPDKFTGKEESFLYWRTRLEAFITSVFGEFDRVPPWCEECTQTITETDIENAWGEISPTHSHVKESQAMNAQLCEGEAFSVIRSAGKNCGLEAWRRLVRRYGPRRTMLRHILNPQKCQKLDDLSKVEVWEEQLRIYESRKRSDGTRHSPDDEIKISILEHLCPTEIERHLQLNRLNRSRCTTYQEVRAEASLYLETRLGSRLKIGTAAHPDEATPMDIGGFGKGKKVKAGKGKSKGKDSKGKGQKAGSSAVNGKGPKTEDRECHNCGKVGHLVKDCWQAGGGQANKPKGGKAKERARARRVSATLRRKKAMESRKKKWPRQDFCTWLDLRTRTIQRSPLRRSTKRWWTLCRVLQLLFHDALWTLGRPRQPRVQSLRVRLRGLSEEDHIGCDLKH